jgi:hypothetical protein
MFSQYKLIVFEAGLLVTFTCWLLIHITKDLGRLVRTIAAEWSKLHLGAQRSSKMSTQIPASPVATRSEAERVVAELFRLK